MGLAAEVASLIVGPRGAGSWGSNFRPFTLVDGSNRHQLEKDGALSQAGNLFRVLSKDLSQGLWVQGMELSLLRREMGKSPAN